MGHNLHLSIHNKTGMRVLACSQCDAYATLLPKGLLDRCKPRDKKPNWERLKDGVFPTRKFGISKVMSLPMKVTGGKQWSQVRSSGESNSIGSNIADGCNRGPAAG